jgi:hypothetical protein
MSQKDYYNLEERKKKVGNVEETIVNLRKPDRQSRRKRSNRPALKRKRMRDVVGTDCTVIEKEKKVNIHFFRFYIVSVNGVEW